MVETSIANDIRIVVWDRAFNLVVLVEINSIFGLLNFALVDTYVCW